MSKLEPDSSQRSKPDGISMDSILSLRGSLQTVRIRLHNVLIFNHHFRPFVLCKNVRKIGGWIWYFGCNRGWWLLEQKSSVHGLEIEQRPCVCVAAVRPGMARIAALRPICSPDPVLHAWARHYLTYYVLGARHTALTSTPGPGLRAHKEIACKLSEKFHHTEHRAASAAQPAAPQFGEDFFRSPITSKFARMTSLELTGNMRVIYCTLWIYSCVHVSLWTFHNQCFD